MSYTYSQWLTALQNATGLYDSTGAQVVQALGPTIVDEAESLLYRDPEFNILAIRDTDTSQTTTKGQRSVPIPGTIMIVEEVALITPTGYQPEQAGSNRITLLRVGKGYIDTCWPQASLTQTPQPFQTYFSIPGQIWTGNDTPVPGSNFIIAPTPDNAYVLAVYGTQRPQALYAVPAGQTTVLSSIYPELFFAATMWAATALVLRNYSPVSEDPQMAQDWGTRFQQLRAVAVGESSRQKSQGQSWLANGTIRIGNISRTSLPGGPPPPPHAPPR